MKILIVIAILAWAVVATGDEFPFSFIKGAAAKGALCLDGSLAGYNFRRGHGSGSSSWMVILDGGGWCSNTDPNEPHSCIIRSKDILGSSKNMTSRNLTAMSSIQIEENPDFYNANMALIRYCDGGSYAGDSEDKANGLYFRGRRIFEAAVDDLLSKGMRHADKALLCGGSAGGHGVFLHCDKFAASFPKTTRVKCMSDAGFFIDAIDISGGHSMRRRATDLVNLQGIEKMLPHSCTNRHGPVSCFFPGVLVNYIKTPMFISNAAYDVAQISAGIASGRVDKRKKWIFCKADFNNCSAPQIAVMQSFRHSMLKGLQGFVTNPQNGAFIDSCYCHSQMGEPAIWRSHHAPRIGNKMLSEVVGDWFFERTRSHMKIGPPFPFQKDCINQVNNKINFNESTRY